MSLFSLTRCVQLFPSGRRPLFLCGWMAGWLTGPERESDADGGKRSNPPPEKKCCLFGCNLLTLDCRNDERRLAQSRPTSGHYRSTPLSLYACRRRAATSNSFPSPWKRRPRPTSWNLWHRRAKTQISRRWAERERERKESTAQHTHTHNIYWLPSFVSQLPPTESIGVIVSHLSSASQEKSQSQSKLRQSHKNDNSPANTHTQQKKREREETSLYHIYSESLYKYYQWPVGQLLFRRYI